MAQRFSTFASGALCIITVALLVGCGSPEPVAGQDTGLVEAERELAAELTRQALEERGLLGGGPAYFVNAQMYREKEAAETGRKALATYYRYAGNMTFLTYVDLSNREIIRIDSVARLPTALAPAELDVARDLALSDSTVRRLLGQYADRAVVEGLVIHTDAEDDPFFDRRIVNLMFRVGSDYVITPPVMVDLMAREVIVEQTER